MRLNKKATLAISGLAAAAAIAGGVVFAGYFGTGSSGGVNGAGETWTTPAVAGAVEEVTGQAGLLPSEVRKVVLTLANTNANLDAKVVTVTANNDVTVDPDSLTNVPENVDPQDVADTCAGWLTQGSDANLTDAQVPAGETEYTLDIPTGITFADTGDEGADQSICQGMTFTASWNVKFKAVRPPVAP